MPFPSLKIGSKSLRIRLVSYFSLLSFATVSGVGVLTFLGAKVVIQRLVFDRLRVTALLKEDALTLWLDNQKEATVGMAQLPEIQQYIESLLTSPPDPSELSSLEASQENIITLTNEGENNEDEKNEGEKDAETQPQNEQNNDSTEIAEIVDIPAVRPETAYINIKRAIGSAIVTRPELAEVFILSKQGGKVVLSTQVENEGEYRVKDQYFKEGLKSTYVQNVYPSSVTGELTITISTPLKDSENQVIGVLGAHLNLEQMDRIVLDRVGLGESGTTYLVDSFNSFVSGDRKGQEEYNRGVHSQGIDNVIQGKDGGGLYDNYAGVPVLGYSLWIDPLEVGLLVEIDQEEAFQPARHLAWGIFLVGSGSVLVFTGGVYWLAKQITHPILAIKDTALQVASGNLEQVVPVLTQDEVGVLATTFNKMTQQLKQLYSGLEEKVMQLELAEMSLRKSLKELEIEQARSERLLLNTLPQVIAQRLKRGDQIIAESYEGVSVMFADLVSFTQLSDQLPPKQLVEKLNAIFSVFDQLTEKHKVEKIKTIGDAYMVVGGLPQPNVNHAQAIAHMALDMLDSLAEFNHNTGSSFNIRIGIHSGSVVAGVIGIRKFSYDLWGDTVNVASRMESQGVPGKIQVTTTTYELLQETFILEKRGTIYVKGKGHRATYFLIGPRES